MKKLPVIFRLDNSGTVVAVFPTIPSDYAGRELQTYVHLGQHGGASWGWYLSRKHRAAKPEEYADLLTELKSIYGQAYGPGDEAFELVPVRKISSAHRREFQKTVDSFRNR